MINLRASLGSVRGGPQIVVVLALRGGSCILQVLRGSIVFALGYARAKHEHRSDEPQARSVG
jgi:hypothetical protein